MSLLLFLPFLIYELLLQRTCFWGWVSLSPGWHTLMGHRWTLLFRRTSPGWCGELAGKRLFSGLRQSPTYKVSYTSKNWCVLLLRGEMCGKEDESAQFASYFCSISGGGKGVTKISRTLVREGICRRSESLFLWFMGVFWWWVSNKKNGATTFDLGNGRVSYFCVELLSIFLKPYRRKYRGFVCFCFVNCI